MALHGKGSQHTISYLLAEDSATDAEIVKVMLANAYGTSCSVLHVENFADIAKALECARFEALILDLNLPDKSGIENVPYLVHRYPALPIVVLTSEDDEQLALCALKRGAQDYLTKQQVTSESLARSLRYAKERKQIEMVLKDALALSEQQNKRLEQCAHYDFLTGLPNRPFFEQVGYRMIRRCSRTADQLALLFLDINQFKHINDSCGRETGDNVLKEVATRLQKEVRESDLVTRYCSDNFVILVELKSDKQEVYCLINRLQKAMEQPYLVDRDQSINCTCAIGVSFYPEAYDLDLLIKQAEHALYEAKHDPAHDVCFYTEQMGNSFSRRNQIATQLAEALKNGEFDVYFQPIYSISSQTFIAVEAFLRWRSCQSKEICPDEFIPIAENCSYIDELTMLVLKKTSQLILTLNSKGIALQSVKVNITLGQMNKKGFAEQFVSWLKTYDIQPSTICIELTENRITSLSMESKINIEQLRSHKVLVAIDNFGTGETSLQQLINLPVDYINIDKCLISKIASDKQHHTITNSIVDTAHNLGIKVVAGGIENKEIYEKSKQLNCDCLQGYYLSLPKDICGLIASNIFH